MSKKHPKLHEPKTAKECDVIAAALSLEFYWRVQNLSSFMGTNIFEKRLIRKVRLLRKAVKEQSQ